MATRGSLSGDYMARRTARKMKRAAAKKTATKRLAQRYEAPTGSLKGREARAEERFRELAAWYMLQGMDEATARQLAQDEMDNETCKDWRASRGTSLSSSGIIAARTSPA